MHRTDRNRSHVSSLFSGGLKAFLVCLLVLPACSTDSSGQPPGKDSKKAQAFPVTVSTAAQKTIPLELHAIGTVQAYSTVAIKAQVEGTLDNVFFQEGQEVKKGALLFTIDPRPFEVQLKQAEANLERDTALAENARLQVRRYEDLVGKGYVSREQYDQFRANAAALERTLLADQANVDTAKLQLEYCSIRSPIGGMTGNLLVHPGNLVKANDADHPLLVVNQVRPIYAVFSFPATNLPEIQRYMGLKTLKVEAIVPDRAAPAALGTLTFLDNTVDPTTGTIQLKAQFPNASKTLWPGQFVNVALTLTSQPDAVVVPTQAIQAGQNGQYVFIVRPDLTAELRPVVAGRAVNGETVVEKGLAPGEQVVTDGQLRLTPGAKVEIKTSPSPAAARETTE
ncbi:MAG: efflux RND transporter periplasmic adaptor subunit [Nitrospirae bacterium]|nr:efflux RND transporter periplasmic adaptor subunit [Nitrospirota bacterium]